MFILTRTCLKPDDLCWKQVETQDNLISWISCFYNVQVKSAFLLYVESM